MSGASDTRLLSKCSGQLAFQSNYQVRFGRIGAADKIVVNSVIKEQTFMSDVAKVPNISTASNGAVKYFKIQVRGWTDFDPLDKKLPEIADAIEQGGGFLTAVEVLDVKDDLSAINDNVVRQGFENILAARRVLRSIGELPTSLVEDLRAALKAPAEMPKKPAGSEDAELTAKRAS